MSTNYKFGDQSQAYFVSFAVVNWADVFIRKEYCEILLESIRYCIEYKGLLVFGWCIMPSHVHLIMGTSKTDMQDILRDMKKFTSKRILEAIQTNPIESRKGWLMAMFAREGERNSNNKNYQFWQQDNHPIELATQYMFDQKLEYVHQNPVVAGFVEEAHHWSLSSARNYADRQVPGPVPLTFGGW